MYPSARAQGCAFTLNTPSEAGASGQTLFDPFAPCRSVGGGLNLEPAETSAGAQKSLRSKMTTATAAKTALYRAMRARTQPVPATGDT